MARSSTTYQPGKAPGPGRRRLPEELKGVASLTKAEAQKALSDVLKLNLEELELLVKDRTIPALKQWAARIVLHGIKQGDQQRLNFMFDRLVGKVTEQVEVQHAMVPTVIFSPDMSQSITIDYVEPKKLEGE